MANSLRALGFQKGDPIAIDLPMNMESVAIYLGIILSGGVVVSIADSFAPTEIEARLKISKAKCIFTQVKTLKTLNSSFLKNTTYCDF